MSGLLLSHRRTRCRPLEEAPRPQLRSAHEGRFVSVIGRPRSEAENYPEILRAIISKHNKTALPTSAKHVAADLKSDTGLTVPLRTMTAVLGRPQFRLVRGKKRNFMAESRGIVAYRTTYTQIKKSNRDKEKYPLVPEVYLDESYCNLHHESGKTWLLEDCVRYAKSGRGKRHCIVGTGVIYTHQDEDETREPRGEWVCDSLKIWQSDLNRSRDEDDYHGIFNAATFETWFEQLCNTLKEDYGNCKVFMDGAAYHKRVINPSPNSSTSTCKTDIPQWLHTNGIIFLANLLELNYWNLSTCTSQKKVCTPGNCEAVRTHRVYTPLYHSEVQPIKHIWGVGKNQVATDPTKDMDALQAKLYDVFGRIDSNVCVGAYHNVQRQENTYWERDGAAEVDLASKCSSSEEETAEPELFGEIVDLL